MSNQIAITLNYDGQTVPHGVNQGTTPQQIAGSNFVRQLLGLPNNVTPMVNGAYSTAPVNSGDVITFQSAPSQKAEEDGGNSPPDKDVIDPPIDLKADAQADAAPAPAEDDTPPPPEPSAADAQSEE